MEIPLTLAGLLCAYLGDRTAGPLQLDEGGRWLDQHDADRISIRLGRAAGVLGGDRLAPHVWRASRVTHLLDALEQDDGEKRFMAGLRHVMIYANHKHPKSVLQYWIRSQVRKNAELSCIGGEVLADLVPPGFTPTFRSSRFRGASPRPQRPGQSDVAGAAAQAVDVGAYSAQRRALRRPLGHVGSIRLQATGRPHGRPVRRAWRCRVLPAPPCSPERSGPRGRGRPVGHLSGSLCLAFAQAARSTPATVATA